MSGRGALVALEDFVTADGEQMFAGISWVSIGHDYLRQYPSKFGAATEAKSKTHAAADRSARPAAKPRRRRPADFVPEVRTNYLAVPEVHFDQHSTEALRSQPFTTFRETGGGLYGRAHGLRVDVIDVCTNADLNAGDPNAMLLDVDAMLEHAAALRCDWVGTWHTHRYHRDGGPAPSLADRSSWSASFEVYARGERPAFVGMILAPSAGPEIDVDPWQPPARAAWVVRTDGDETVIDVATLGFTY